MSLNQMFFIPIFIASSLLFAFSCYQRLRLVAVGTSEIRTDRPIERLRGTLAFAFAQKRVVQRPYGINHFVLFWAFMVLVLANGEFLVAGLVPDLNLGLLPAPLYHALLLAFEIVSALALFSVILAAARRLFFPPDYLANDYASPGGAEAFVILGFIATLMIAYFLLHAAEIALGQRAPAAYMPIASGLASALGPVSQGTLETIAAASWWAHALVLLAFMNLLPRSKHMHILTAIPNCFFRSLEKTGTVPRERFEKGERFGADSVDRLSWKDLLDSFTCTECGRCQDLCPARRTGKALNPRRVIHDIKVNLLENGASVRDGRRESPPLIGEGKEGATSEEALWDCTTCGACLGACPVLIEHTPKILKMRRHLVQMEARFPEELLNLFENMEQRSNPWGIAPSERAKWCGQLGDRSFDPETCEYLFFVGCAGAFDTRNKHVTVALATLLDSAGVTWGILGKDEPCCGDSLRRLGNEYVFDRMARQNVELFREKKVRKIITQCPHCFSTLKNDYRQYGLEVEVIHHSRLIADLFADGRKLPRQVELGKVLFHDSCYLGRHNDLYDAPRRVVQAATGRVPAEFIRNRENSFCCGAGGGRMWMEELTGSRINLDRVRQGLVGKPDTICVSCPYCLTMMEDGLKDEQAENVAVKDIAEVLAEAMRPEA